MIKKLIKILSFYSISPDKTNCQEYIGSLFKKIGFQIFTIKHKNIRNSVFLRYIKRKKNKVDIAFVGHTDVVPSKNRKIFLKKKKIYSRGIVDMKGSIYCFYKAVKLSIKKKINKTIAVILSGDEEGRARYGIKEIIKLIKKKIKIKNCIIGEPTSNVEIGDTLKTERRGSYNFKITIKDKKRHNAYYNNKAFNKLKYLINFFYKKKINVYDIKTDNNKTNIIPGKIFVYLNYRYPSKKELLKSLKKILFLFKKKKIKGEISRIQNSKPYKSKKKSFCKNIYRILHKKFFIKTKVKNKTGGTSDGRYLKKMVDNIVELGLKNKYAHRNNEKANINEIFKLIIIYYKILIC
ncbi:N-succinyl-L L-diaminopimelate desuccinylase [Candidatus Vidania fulgoroideae]|nr:N-succinyl-L L-diaminopimelate desuccinylase [Candidatus Vidania fulgoroideae]